MKKIRFIGVLVFSLIVMCWTSGAQAISECCPTPPACVPTMACPLQMSAGQTEQPTNKTIQKISATYEKASQAYRKVTKEISKLRKSVVSIAKDIKDVAIKAVKWPFKYAGKKMGLLKEDEDDKNNVTQDNSHNEDSKVGDRIAKNLPTYEDESKSDYASEYFTVQRRKYIRQQATITLMARMLTLKSNLKDIKELVDEVSKNIEEQEAKSGAASKGMMSTEKDNSEAVIIKSNQQLRLIWFQLLTYQRMIEAIKLEFAANQSISGMKLVKNVPQIESSGTDGGGSTATSGGK